MREWLLPFNLYATAGGITNIPTNQSATANDITKQFVTVRNLLVVKTANMTKVLPMTVTTITMLNNITNATTSVVIGGPGVDEFVTFDVLKFCDIPIHY